MNCKVGIVAQNHDAIWVIKVSAVNGNMQRARFNLALVLGFYMLWKFNSAGMGRFGAIDNGNAGMFFTVFDDDGGISS